METLFWLISLVLVAALGLALSSRTVRRFVYTAFVVFRAVLAIQLDKLRGKKGTGPVRLREAFEGLGPTYVKLAQLVASSEGMFPDAYCLEFQKCLDRVPSFSINEVRQILREDLGKEPEEIFRELDDAPLASASIAQVHCAVLRDGTSVVLKVQRPNLPRVVTADLRVLRVGARIMARLPSGDMASPVGVVEDFAANLAEELDFRNEAKNLDQFNQIMMEHGFSGVTAPVPHHDLSSARTLVIERFYGSRIDDTKALARFADQLEDKLIMGLRAWFRCLLVHGFFHGDVHAGNLMVLDDGRVGFLDFGIVGRFEGARRQLVSDFLMATAMRDFKKLGHTMLAMAGAAGNPNEAALSADLESQLAPLLDPSKPAKYADMIPAMTRSGLRYRVAMPRDFVLILKQMIYFDRYAKLLAPKLNIFADPRIIKNLMEDLMLAQAAKNKTQAA